MVVEILNEAAEWRVELPNEDVYRHRVLEMRDGKGNCVGRWERGELRWVWDEAVPPLIFSVPRWDWHQIVGVAIRLDCSLFSLPATGGSET